MSKFLEDFIEYSEVNVKVMNKNIKHRFSSGVLAATYAAAKENPIGILTARVAKENHKPMIKLFRKVVGSEIKDEHNYFVNDSELSKRLFFCGRDTAMKKLHILVEYATGFKISEDGKIEERKKNNSVKFYDDEEKNLKILEDQYFNSYLKTLEKHLLDSKNDEKKVSSLISRIKTAKKNISVYNIANFDASKLETKGGLKMFIKNLKNKMKGGKIHFFDLDGTVFTHSVKLFVVKGEESLFAITQEEFAEGRKIDLSAAKVLSKEELEKRKHIKNITELIKNAKEGKEGYSIDFKYFKEKELIKEQVKINNIKAKKYED